MKISAKQYAQALYDITEGKDDVQIKTIIARFVSYMRDAGDLKKVREVISQFSIVYNERNSITEVIVTTRYPLSDNEKERVRAFIAKQYEKQNIVIRQKVKKDIKGGIVIRIGDDVLDGSVRERLAVLNRHLLQV